MSESSSVELHPLDDEQRTIVLVTGANSGVGFGICKRLIDQFILSRPKFQSLTLIFTTRSEKKGRETINALRNHIKRKSGGQETPIASRITLQPESLDLTSILSVHELATKLCKCIPHLDSIVLNAGLGGYTGVDTPKALYRMATSLVQAVSYPDYKCASTGLLAAPQRLSQGREMPAMAQPLGQVFISNVLGHYILSHLLTPILNKSSEHGRIIFTSSLEAYPTAFTVDDIQCLQTDKAYESSKRLTDILVLTSNLPSTSPFTGRFFSQTDEVASSAPSSIRLNDNAPKTDRTASTKIALDDHTNPSRNGTPSFYLTHPGLCATSFMPQNALQSYISILLFLLCRLLGSPWHTTTAYKGANAPVWLALADKEEIDDIETEGGKGKWGSGTDWLGRERIFRTAVEGWGAGGRVGVAGGVAETEALGRARGRGQVNKLTREGREGFEELGREAWKQMEELRVAWERWVVGEQHE